MTARRRRTAMYRWMPLAAAMMVVALAGCGPPAVSAGPDGGEPAQAGNHDGTWRLVSGRGPSGRIPLPSHVTLVIDGRDLSGTSACNHYNTTATIDGTSFAAAGVGTTAVGCPGKRTTAEARYTEALEAATTIERDDDRLDLTGDGVALRFEVVPPPEPVALENTTWHLGGIVFGRGPDGTVTDNEPATLTLHDDGRLTGSTGCRRLHGSWEQVDGLYRTNELTPTGPFTCPRHRHEQDAHVLDVLDDAFEVHLDVRNLDLYQAGGELGLFYGADS